MRWLLPLLLVLAACGSDDRTTYHRPDSTDVQLIKDCVSAGGVPYYTFNDYGHAYYITCDELPG